MPRQLRLGSAVLQALVWQTEQALEAEGEVGVLVENQGQTCLAGG